MGCIKLLPFFNQKSKGFIDGLSFGSAKAPLSFPQAFFTHEKQIAGKNVLYPKKSEVSAWGKKILGPTLGRQNIGGRL